MSMFQESYMKEAADHVRQMEQESGDHIGQLMQLLEVLEDGVIPKAQEALALLEKIRPFLGVAARAIVG